MSHFLLFMLLPSRVLAFLVVTTLLPMVHSYSHLVVLAHGLAGKADDLLFLSQSLMKDESLLVLSTKVNEANSRDGIIAGGERLAQDVLETIKGHGTLKQISFVGNSLGGLYVRYCTSLLFEESDGSIAGLEPTHFVTIASPWLGVRFHTFLNVPHWVSRPLVTLPNGQTGIDLFLDDEGMDQIENTLVFRMATAEGFLAPLRFFRTRRCYANYANDFLVPVGTAAFLTSTEKKDLETQISARGPLPNAPSIIATLRVPPQGVSPAQEEDSPHPMDRAAASINALGWEKVLVYFPDWLPLSHNKICALDAPNDPLRYFVAATLSNSQEGKFVMEHLAMHLSSDLCEREGEDGYHDGSSDDGAASTRVEDCTACVTA